jgi:elongator complex protein 3
MEEYTNSKNLIENLERLLKKEPFLKPEKWSQLVRKYRKNDDSIPSKNYILQHIKKNNIEVKKETLEAIKMKPTRTISGVTPITIFTKPYKCSGNCIFCPTSSKTPKSYLLEEPGIQRASALNYNPYDQVKLRIRALEAIGHNTDKIELIISGGTWDDYDLNYRIWYITEVFRALNGVYSEKFCEKTNYKKEIDNLKKLQEENTHAKRRNVGICIETRPDKINIEALKWYRIFGVTKVQLGVQSLNEKILEANTRGHSREEVFKAMELLRLLGVNIHIHWMCNLYKGNPKLDFEDFEEIFSNERAKPDEIKMYPCSMVEGIKLYEIYKKGGYEPYTTQTLIELLAKCKELVPNYCRINRLMRDIPSQLIMVGNKSTNLREKVQDFMKEKNKSCKCIRCREIKNKEHGLLKLKKTIYQTSISTEYFLEYVTEENKIAGFLRLSIYKKRNALLVDTPAMVRELHIYGTSLNLKDKSKYSNQHKGFGSKLLLEAEKIAKDLKIEKMAIISGVGTRNYYKKRGYVIEKEYGYALKNLK